MLRNNKLYVYNTAREEKSKTRQFNTRVGSNPTLIQFIYDT